MKNSIFALSACLALAAGSLSAQTVDGVLGAGEGYTVATNSAAGIDSNVNFGFGTSSKSELVRAKMTGSVLYIFIEGDLHSGNRVNVLIDADANAATGVSAAFPDGSFGESNGMERFTDVADGGWDTLISIGSAGGEPTTQLFVTAIGYTSAGAIEIEDYLGTPGASVLAGAATGDNGAFRTVASTDATPVLVGLTPGDAVDNGIELAIPLAYLGTTGANFRLAVLNTNGGSDFFSDSTIPQNANGGNLGAGPGIAAMASLTAPVFASSASSVSDWFLVD